LNNMTDQVTTTDSDTRLDWYLKAKFGLFIHWGPYAVAGIEASWPIMAPELSEAMFGTKTRITEAVYRGLPERFNPVDFDPDSWVSTAWNAGMEYIVMTAKHHDGFCMFDAPGTDYKITNTPYCKDICQELANACARAGIPLGFYYSPPDMHHPGYRDTRLPAVKNWLGEPGRSEWFGYLDYMESHIRALLTNYGEVSILWFDGLVNHAKYDPARFHQLVHDLSPKTLINDRLGAGYDFITPEQFIPNAGISVQTGKLPSGDDPGAEGLFRAVNALIKVPGIRTLIRKQLDKYGEGKLELNKVAQEPYPSPERFQPWETCMTMGKSWAHNPDETDWKAPGELLHNLTAAASRGGNYLLNVGPTALGTFPPEAVERLDAIGRWMDIYQEAIHGTIYKPLGYLSWGSATRKGDQLYLFIFDWPADGVLEVDPFPGTVCGVRVYNGDDLSHRIQGTGLSIDISSQAPDSDLPVLVVEINSAEPGWRDYAQGAVNMTAPQKYLRAQVIANTLINALLNIVIAYFLYRNRDILPFSEVAADILITVGIISFLVSWIAVWGTRSELLKGKIGPFTPTGRKSRLPHRSALRALVITIVCMFGFGGILVGFIALLGMGDFGNWIYIGFKTVYTGACAALAAALAIQSVFTDVQA
jgi:alpha-L-fucosidase